MADKQIKIGLFADDQASAKLVRVGQAAENAGGKMRSGSKEAEEYGGHLNAAGEHADGAERNLIGLHDVVDGTATIMAGPGKAGITAYIQGWADLAGGLAPLLPSLSALRLSNIRNTVATTASTVASKAAAIGSKAWAAAQWLLNAALSANPIGAIIVGLIALGVGLVLAYKHSEKFRAVVQGAFRVVLAAGRALGSGIAAVAHGIGAVFGPVGNAITAPFRFAFNGIRALWNSTLGGKGFSVPSWVPGIGGKGFTIPYLAKGGIVTGPTLAMIGEAGSEAVIPLDRAGGMLGGGSQQPLVVQLVLDGKVVQESLLKLKRGNGGLALGIASSSSESPRDTPGATHLPPRRSGASPQRCRPGKGLSSVARPTYVLECAFASNPDDPAAAQVWTDITPYLDVQKGVTITRGRTDEFSDIQPSKLSLTLNNRDGRFTPENTSSPYYPNVKTGKRIRLGLICSGTTYWRFTGDVDEWPLTWQGGPAAYAESVVTATDRLKKLGDLGEYQTFLKEDVLDDLPVAYYPLDEPAGSTSLGDISGNSQPPLVGVQVGTGGTIQVGYEDTDPPTLPVVPAFYVGKETGVRLQPASVGNGRYLRANLNAPTTGALGASVVVYASQDPAPVTTAPLALFTAANGSYFGVDKDAGGDVQAVFFDATTGTLNTTNAPFGFTTAADQFAAVLDIPSPGNGRLTYYLGGVVADTAIFAMAAVPAWTLVSVGGQAKRVMKGTVSHAQFYDYPVDLNVLGVQWWVANHGLDTDPSVDTTDFRMVKLLGFRGLPDTLIGVSQQLIGPQEITGNPLDAIRLVETTEGGLFFIRGDGLPVYQLRNFRFNAAAAITLPADRLDPSSLSFRGDDFGLVNDVTASRPDGATARYVNPASVDDHGRRKASISALSAADQDLSVLAAWRANTYGTQRNRLSGVRISLLNDVSLLPTALMLDLGSLLSVTGLPTQSPSSTKRVFVEGWQEKIGEDEWSMDFTTSSAEVADVWQIGVAGHSEIGTTTRIGY